MCSGGFIMNTLEEVIGAVAKKLQCTQQEAGEKIDAFRREHKLCSFCDAGERLLRKPD